MDRLSNTFKAARRWLPVGRDTRCTGGGAVQPAGTAPALLGARPRQALRSVWPALYACMGIAAWLVWRRGGLAGQAGPLAAYAGLLAASWLVWPPLFGGGRSLPRACLDAAGELPSVWHYGRLLPMRLPGSVLIITTCLPASHRAWNTLASLGGTGGMAWLR